MGYQNDTKREISQQIAEAMQGDTPPWKQPLLDDSNSGIPTNALTKQRYNGINPLILEMASLRKGFTSKWWATYQQWERLGCHVKKRPDDVPDGNWGTKIVAWKLYEKPVAQKDGTIKTEKFRLLKRYVVFNADQVFGLSAKNYRTTISEAVVEPDYDQVDRIIAATGAEIRWGYPEPYYDRPPADRICLPSRRKFLNDRQLYSTIFHEIFHWLEWRTGWAGPEHLGELAAEIGTGYLESELALPHCDDMTNYKKWLPVWLAEIEKNPDYIFEAASQAARGVDFVLGFTRLQEREPIDG